MISKEAIFNTLFEENLSTNAKLVRLNQQILNLEDTFKEKYGTEAFQDYCEISELMLEKLLEYTDFGFKTGSDLRKYMKN